MDAADSSPAMMPKCPGKVTSTNEEGQLKLPQGPSPRTGGNRTQRRRAATAESATQEDQCHPRKIFVGGLAHKTTTQFLRDYFAKYGTIVDAVVLRWPDGRSRGFGYVTFADTAGAFAALQEQHQVGGRQVDVKRAVPGTNKLFVGGLPQNTSAQELRDHFEAFGVVSDAVVMIDPATNRSRGFGFVCFLPGQEGAASAQFALDQYEQHRIRGKWIEVKSAAPPHKLVGKDGSSSPTSTSGESGTSPLAAEVPAPKAEVPAPKAVMSLATALKAGPTTFDRPVASPQHRRQPQAKPQSYDAAAQEPHKVALSGMVGTPPGLGGYVAQASDASPAAFWEQNAEQDSEVSPFGHGWPTTTTASNAQSGAAWRPPSCLSLSSALGNMGPWQAGGVTFPQPVDERSSLYATSDLQRSLEQLIRLQAQGGAVEAQRPRVVQI
ncbi:unnamed protein product [Polarella glacialis]|uniref:RRM domain-containing protein n=1 Tax=Polarella glacialis TaxID=89957 RepID=A0A813FTH8_POLGL|nr:unnamed protein product [Polarella glacialis]